MRASTPALASRLAEVVATDAHEGPVYVASEDALYFTTVRPRVAIRRLALDGRRFPLEPARITTIRADTGVANGMTLGHDGRLVVCEQGTLERPAAIVAVDPATGRSETLVDAFEGRRLNSPNDVVVTGDGAIWFTDPSYGHEQGFRPAPELPDAVYRRAADGRVSMVLDHLDKPNGLAFAPGESVLYVGDNGAPHRLLAYDVARNGALSGERVVATLPPEHPDGVKVDRAGRIYASAPDGVRVFDPGGAPLGVVPVPGAVTFALGGTEPAVLFITTDAAVWAAVLDLEGA